MVNIIIKNNQSHPAKKIKRNCAGFTLFEIIVSVTLLVIIVILVSDFYLINQRAYNKNADIAELTQNSRVSLDRITRELRQSADIITTLPPAENDINNPPAEQIFFQDGHNIDQITYLRYYLDGNELKREHKAFYFSGEPSTYVAYNSLDQGGSAPLETIFEDQVVGEYFNNLKFWGSGGLINISLNLLKNINSLNIRSMVYSRNY